jgi:hypothetical protein
MAINVTVAGVGGTTVTLPWTSVSNAAAAQSALAGITNLVKGGVLTQVNYTGGSALPPVGTTDGGVVATDSVSGLSPFAIGGQYVSAVLGGSGVQDVLVNFGSNNATVVSGAGGATIGGSSGTPTIVGGPGGAEVGNLGTNTQVYFGGATTQNFSELGLGAFGGSVNPSATVWVTNPLRGQATFDDSSGETTINLDTVASSLSVAHPFGQTLILLNSGNGQTTVNIASALPGTVTDGDALSFRGTSAVATTVNAAGSSVPGTGVTMWALMKSGNAFINGDGSNVILFPTGSGTSATLFGGSGSDIDVGGAGFIQGGSAGNNVLFGSTVAGATTLIGGGEGDVLVQQSSGNMMTAGVGNEQLFALGGQNTIAGFAGTQTAGASTFMDGLFGGDTYETGSGTTTIVSANDTNGGNLFEEGVKNAGGSNATISGFVSGTDTISLFNPGGAGTDYSLVAGSTTVAPTPGQVTFDNLSSGNAQVSFGDGTTWTLLNVQLQNTDFKG